MVSDESTTTEVLANVAVAAFPVHDPELPEVSPVTLPVILPANVEVKTPVPALYVIAASVLGPSPPVADSNNAT